VGEGWTGVTSPSDGGDGLAFGGFGVFDGFTGGGAGMLPLSVDGVGVLGTGVADGVDVGAGVELGDGVAVGAASASGQSPLFQSLIAALTAGRKSGKSTANSSPTDSSVRWSALRECSQLSIFPSRRKSRYTRLTTGRLRSRACFSSSGVGVGSGVGVAVGVGVGVAVGVWDAVGVGVAWPHARPGSATTSAARQISSPTTRIPPEGSCHHAAAMKLLVTGGAGYIGSIVAQQLLENGHEVMVLDDLSRGHRGAVPRGAGLVETNLLDEQGTRAALAGGFDGVLHFAALALVEESVANPERYHRGNVVGTLNLLDAMRDAGVRRLVFSSTCAVYGEPDRVPIREDFPTAPVNAYGNSKLAVDRMIGDECRAHGLGAASLRYFNVAGAHGDLGEDHEPETHLIPLVLRAAAGTSDHVKIFGTDYPTRDGTPVRDYIHVEDLGRAHILALEALTDGRHAIYNLGTGDGYTVREVVDAARRVTSRDIPAREEDRRPGDPAALVAASDHVRDDLGWEPEKGLDEMIGDAWTWYQAHPDGYVD
jgi:UDP-glucose 4-epimerase